MVRKIILISNFLFLFVILVKFFLEIRDAEKLTVKENK